MLPLTEGTCSYLLEGTSRGAKPLQMCECGIFMDFSGFFVKSGIYPES